MSRLKSNRPIRLEDGQGTMPWPSATLDAVDFQAVLWPNPNGDQIVYAHLLRTRVKKLGACQVLIIREKPEARAWVIARHEERQLEWICHLARQGVKPAIIKQALCPAFPPSNC